MKETTTKIHQMYEEALSNVNTQIQSTVAEMGTVIKHELRKAIGKEILNFISPDRRTAAQSNTPHSNADSKSARKKSGEMMSEHAKQITVRKPSPDTSGTQTNNYKAGGGPGLGISFFGGTTTKDQDQMTVAKSAFTGKQSRYNRASGVSQKTQEVILNKHKVVRDKEEITHKLKTDDHIHFDKIKKYFENVLNE